MIKKKFLDFKKISLGTAQFGMNYGINNKNGKIKYFEAKKIINFAKKIGVKNIDTAYSYGDAESVLGRIGVDNFKITSKLPYISKFKEKNILFYTIKILKNLKINSLYCLLVHHPKNLKDNLNVIYKELIKLKKKKLVNKIGVSFTHHNDLYKIIKKYNFDVIQLSYNILDQRLDNKKLLRLIKKKKIEIQVRSIFLQGILLKSFNYFRNKFKYQEYDLKKIKFFFKKNKNDRLNFMLSFVNKNKFVKNIIVGFDSKKQLVQFTKLDRKEVFNYKKLSCNDSKIINPYLWNNI